MNNKDFAVFILTHGRPDSVCTATALIKHGYTGKTYIIVDDEDATVKRYQSKFDNVVVFDKKAISKITDGFDNFDDRRAIIYARNACFEIAKQLDIKYFLQLDDDYDSFGYRLFTDKAIHKPVKNLDLIFDLTIEYYKSIAAKSIAYCQGGDFIGGLDNGIKLFRFSKRKAMNTFFCSTDRPFKFIGRINEDVNTYTSYQSKGNLFLTLCNLSINQKTTQSNKGGMSDLYIANGTYIKSFYTIICSPSSVHIDMMKSKNIRLHHSINWPCAVPQIINEKYKK